MKDKKDFKQYGSSSNNNFKVVDTIGVPHPYCISPKHLQYNDSMYLGSEQIIKMEKDHDNVRCDICLNNHDHDKILLFEEHKQALLVECKADIKNNDDLKEYLLSIKDLADKNNFVGFAFLDKRKKQ